jgi:WD40 repeat protein
VAFSPDGSLIMTGSVDQTARLWQTETRSPWKDPLQHHGTVRSVAFSPDGRMVLTASEDHTAQLWDVATGKPCGPPLQHASAIGSAVFSPDGRTIATAGAEKTARLWGVPLRMEGTVERIVLWTKVITGMELDPTGEARVLDAQTWEQYREALEELGGQPAG